MPSLYTDSSPLKLLVSQIGTVEAPDIITVWTGRFADNVGSTPRFNFHGIVAVYSPSPGRFSVFSQPRVTDLLDAILYLKSVSPAMKVSLVNVVYAHETTEEHSRLRLGWSQAVIRGLLEAWLAPQTFKVSKPQT